jgi:hypothetical protein
VARDSGFGIREVDLEEIRDSGFKRATFKLLQCESTQSVVQSPRESPNVSSASDTCFNIERSLNEVEHGSGLGSFSNGEASHIIYPTPTSTPTLPYPTLIYRTVKFS